MMATQKPRLHSRLLVKVGFQVDAELRKHRKHQRSNAKTLRYVNIRLSLRSLPVIPASRFQRLLANMLPLSLHRLHRVRLDYNTSYIQANIGIK